MSDPDSAGPSAPFLVLGTETAYLGLFDAADLAREYAEAAPDRRCFDASGQLLEPEGADGWAVEAAAPQDDEVRSGVRLVLEELDETLRPLRTLVENGAPAAKVIAEIDRNDDDDAPLGDSADSDADGEGLGKKIKKVLGGLF